jgi:hypothetical protein
MLEPVLVLAAAVADAFRSRAALLTEIALLRHQLAVLQRSVARPRVARFDRIVLIALAAVTPTWRNVLRIVQPDTLLRWHRARSKALWRWRRRKPPASRLAAETVALIRSMASANRLWGAERKGTVLKLLADLGATCCAYLDANVRSLRRKRLQSENLAGSGTNF